MDYGRCCGHGSVSLFCSVALWSTGWLFCCRLCWLFMPKTVTLLLQTQINVRVSLLCVPDCGQLGQPPHRHGDGIEKLAAIIVSRFSLLD